MPEKLYNMLRGVSAANRGWLEGQLAVEEAQNQHEKALLAAQLDALKMQKDVAQTRLDYQVKVEGARQKRAELKSLDAHRRRDVELRIEKGRNDALREQRRHEWDSALEHEEVVKVDGQWAIRTTKYVNGTPEVTGIRVAKPQEIVKGVKMERILTSDLYDTHQNTFEDAGVTANNIGDWVVITGDLTMYEGGLNSVLAVSKVHRDRAPTQGTGSPSSGTPAQGDAEKGGDVAVDGGKEVVIGKFFKVANTQGKNVRNEHLRIGETGPMGGPTNITQVQPTIGPWTVKGFAKALRFKEGTSFRWDHMLVTDEFVEDLKKYLKTPTPGELLRHELELGDLVLKNTGGRFDVESWTVKVGEEGLTGFPHSVSTRKVYSNLQLQEAETDTLTERQQTAGTGAVSLHASEQILSAMEQEVAPVLTGAYGKDGLAGWHAAFIALHFGPGADQEKAITWRKILGLHKDDEAPTWGKLLGAAGQMLSMGGLSAVDEKVLTYLSAANRWVNYWTRMMTGQAIKEGEKMTEYVAYFPQPGDSAEAVADKIASRHRVVLELIHHSGGMESFQRRFYGDLQLPDVQTPERAKRKRGVDRIIQTMLEYREDLGKDAEGRWRASPWEIRDDVVKRWDAELKKAGYDQLSAQVIRDLDMALGNLNLMGKRNFKPQHRVDGTNLRHVSKSATLHEQEAGD